MDETHRASRRRPPRAGVWCAVCVLAVAAVTGVMTPGQTTQAAGGKVMYRSAYGERDNLARWSKGQTVTTKGRVMLGKFHNDTESLKLEGLPAHGFVRVRAQLLIMDSWDGGEPGDGPDEMIIRLGDGRVLMQATMMLYKSDDPRRQSFPDNYGTGEHPSRTGVEAVEVDWVPRGAETWGGNAVYRVEFVFPHTGGDLRVDFRGSLVDSDATIKNESWGLGEVEVEVLPEAPVKLDAAAGWEAIAMLGGADPVAASQAMNELTGAGDAGVAAVRRYMDGRVPASSAHVAALIKQLDDDKYAVREAAQKELEAMGPTVREQCAAALRAGVPMEAKGRLEQIVARLDQGGNARTDQRLWRVLEIIGTKEALALRERLQAGGPLPDMETLRQALEVDAAQWERIRIALSQVVAMMSKPQYARALGDFQRRGNGSQEMAILKTLLDLRNKITTDFNPNMDAARKARGKMNTANDAQGRAALDEAERQLRMLLSPRQEAVLVSLNVLE
jgi:hypothetical protein